MINLHFVKTSTFVDWHFHVNDTHQWHNFHNTHVISPIIFYMLNSEHDMKYYITKDIFSIGKLFIMLFMNINCNVLFGQSSKINLNYVKQFWIHFKCKHFPSCKNVFAITLISSFLFWEWQILGCYWCLESPSCAKYLNNQIIHIVRGIHMLEYLYFVTSSSLTGYDQKYEKCDVILTLACNDASIWLLGTYRYALPCITLS